jgi:hypothetical protein
LYGFVDTASTASERQDRAGKEGKKESTRGKHSREHDEETRLSARSVTCHESHTRAPSAYAPISVRRECEMTAYRLKTERREKGRRVSQRTKRVSRVEPKRVGGRTNNELLADLFEHLEERVMRSRVRVWARGRGERRAREGSFRSRC